MEIRKLEAFCKVIDNKSFTRAAKAMLLSQPTVSEHIKFLEDELEQKLIERTGRVIEPTPVGRLFYDYAKKILNTKEEAIQAVAQFSGNMTGRMSIGCGTIPGTYIVPSLVGKFRSEHPSIQATIIINSSRIIAEMVLQGELELGIVGAQWKETGLEWSRIYGDELIVVLPPGHPLAARKTLTLPDILTVPYINREKESGTRKVIAEILTKNSLREHDLQEVAEIGSTAAVKEAVKAEVGIAIISKLAAADDISCGRLVGMTIKNLKMNRPFFMICRKNRELSPLATVFQEYIRSSLPHMEIE